MDIEYQRNEGKIIEQIKEYVDATYSQHYAGKVSVLDVWDSMGISKEAYRSNIVKYAMRFGKKEGDNPLDILKVIHYCIFLLNETTKEQTVK